MIRFLILALVALAGPLRAEPFTPELFERWVEARAGDGKPVYWYSIGTMRSYPDGKLLYIMEGYDTARMFRPDPAKPLAHQYNRKIYIARDPETNAVLKQEPVAYPYQFISYELKGEGLETWVEQGKGAGVRRIGPGTDMKVRMLGDTAVFTAPLFLDLPVPGGRYQAFENYDFLIQPKGAVKTPYQLSWVKYGNAPAWAGGGPAISHLVTYRIDRYEDVPKTLRDYIEAEAPLWKAPPVNLDEIRNLQK